MGIQTIVSKGYPLQRNIGLWYCPRGCSDWWLANQQITAEPPPPPDPILRNPSWWFFGVGCLGTLFRFHNPLHHIKLQRIFPLLNTFCVNWWVPVIGCWSQASRCTCPCTCVPGRRIKARATKQHTKITPGQALLQKARSAHVDKVHKRPFLSAKALVWSPAFRVRVRYLGMNFVSARLSLSLHSRGRAAVHVPVEYQTVRAIEDQWIPL